MIGAPPGRHTIRCVAPVGLRTIGDCPPRAVALGYYPPPRWGGRPTALTGRKANRTIGAEGPPHYRGGRPAAPPTGFHALFPRSHAPRGNARPDALRPVPGRGRSRVRLHRGAVEDPFPRGAWERGDPGVSGRAGGV